MATEFVRTFARVRPATLDSPAFFADGKSIVAQDGKRTTFDGSYGPDSQQSDVFDSVGKKIVDGAIDGISGTIFAYGQTGSGKTYTMMGPSQDGDFLLEGDDRGLIPRCIGAAFAKLEDRRREMGSRYNYKVMCTFVEIYNENIRDLLSDNHQVTIRADQKITLDGAVREEVASDVDALRLVQQGLSTRQVGQTAMNNQSSRSHAIFVMEIETEETEDGVRSRRQSRICMVDLAGSERQQHAQTAGQQLKEAGGINKSLTILARVIRILAEKKEGMHVPFRDSRLTLLLRDSLGGNSRTAVIVALHPGSMQERESKSTLQFADCCKKIKNKTVANKTVTGVSIAALQARIAQLEEANEELSKGKELVEEELSVARHEIDEMKRDADEMERRNCKVSPSKKARRRTTQHETRLFDPSTVSLWDDEEAAAEEPMDTTVTATHRTAVAGSKALEMEVAALQERLRIAMEDASHSQQQAAHLSEAKLREAKDELALLEQRLVDNERQKATIVNEKKALEKEVETTKAHAYQGEQRLRAEIFRKEAAIQELEEMLRAAAAERNEVIEDMEQGHLAALAVKDDAIGCLQERLRTAMEEANQGQQKVSEISGEAAAVETRLREAKDGLDLLERRLVDSERQKAAIIDEKKALEKDVEEAANKANELDELLETSREKFSALSLEKTALETALEAAGEDKTRLEGQLRGLQQQINTLSEDKTELEAALAEMTDKKAGVEAQLAEMCSSKQNTRQKVSILQNAINERDRLQKELDALKKRTKNS